MTASSSLGFTVSGANVVLLVVVVGLAVTGLLVVVRRVVVHLVVVLLVVVGLEVDTAGCWVLYCTLSPSGPTGGKVDLTKKGDCRKTVGLSVRGLTVVVTLWMAGFLLRGLLVVPTGFCLSL